jgi:hypothetical protein
MSICSKHFYVYIKFPLVAIENIKNVLHWPQYGKSTRVTYMNHVYRNKETYLQHERILLKHTPKTITSYLWVHSKHHKPLKCVETSCNNNKNLDFIKLPLSTMEVHWTNSSLHTRTSIIWVWMGILRLILLVPLISKLDTYLLSNSAITLPMAASSMNSQLDG